MSDPDEPPAPAELERLACAAAQAGAQVVARKSSPTDLVTQTDLHAEELVRDVLLEAIPASGILAEEDGITSPESRLQWVIDPLDGTINFVYGIPLFAVSIAAAVDGEVVAGAVADALAGELFSAHRGGGARRNGRPISVSELRHFHKRS